MSSIYNRPCKAMEAKGITDPNCQEGIDFCIYDCPHPHCVVLEDTQARVRERRRKYHRHLDKSL